MVYWRTFISFCHLFYVPLIQTDTTSSTIHLLHIILGRTLGSGYKGGIELGRPLFCPLTKLEQYVRMKSIWPFFEGQLKSYRIQQKVALKNHYGKCMASFKNVVQKISTNHSPEENPSDLGLM